MRAEKWQREAGTSADSERLTVVKGTMEKRALS